MTQSDPSTGRMITPFNVIAGGILLGGAIIAALRFTGGLSATTNLTHDNPWGLWIGFDVLTGVALAAGGFVISSAVYLFGMKEYKPIVRPAILTAFLGYFLVVVGLLLDLGRPWRLPYPFIVKAGPTSALFEVALCVALYLTTLFVEFTPAVFEWRGWKNWRRIVGSMTIALTIFGVILSTLHQSTLGTLFVASPTRLHPLWYSSYLPILFFVSSVAAGISMVTFEGWVTHGAFHDQVQITKEHFDRLTIGLGKAGCVVLAIYFSIKVVDLFMAHEFALLATGWGLWFLVELLGFVALPCILFLIGSRELRPRLVRTGAFITVVGIVLNRINVSVIAYDWLLPADRRYIPHWMEIWVSMTLVTMGVLAFRWIARRMPIMYEHPDYVDMH